MDMTVSGELKFGDEIVHLIVEGEAQMYQASPMNSYIRARDELLKSVNKKEETE